MTKSRSPGRLSALAALLAAPAAVSAQPVTPEEAIARQREEIRDVVNQDCAPAAGPDEVVVCGRRPQLERFRVPLSELPPGSRRRETAGGEQLRAMNAGSEACSTVGPMPYGCTRGLDVMAIGATLLRLIRQARENRD
jgi:hypothetical protein